MIEDIHYLKENSEHDYVMVFIDSGKRDRDTWPTPSEYSVTFDPPFKNVYSVEIVDAALPTTMFNIDKYSNELMVTTVTTFESSPYDLRQNIEEISTSVDFIRYFDDQQENTLLVCDPAAITWYDINNPLYTDKNTNYRLALKSKIENVSISTLSNQVVSDYHVFEYTNKKMIILNIPANQPIIDILEKDNFYLVPRLDGNFDVIYYEYKYISLGVMNSIISDSAYFIRIMNNRFTMPIGNYNVSDFRFELNTLWNDAFNIYVDPMGLYDTRQGKYRYYSSNLFLFNTRVKSMSNVIGFDLNPSAEDSTQYGMMTIGKNKNIFISIFNNAEQRYEIIPPGMTNLGGERFLILRCPEIESHMYGSYAFTGNTPGIGLFKIAASQNETTHLRWDFNTLIRKPIHPIGKLPKMTFRFELPDGRSYDFKGINHQFLLAIKYYVPSSKTIFDRYTLNPNYNPDTRNYLVNSKTTQYKEENAVDNGDGEDEDEDDEEKYKFYKKQLDKYDHGDEDETSSDDDTSEDDA